MPTPSMLLRTDPPISLTAPSRVDLLAKIQDLRAAAPVLSLSFAQQETAGEFRFEVTLEGGQTWAETLTYNLAWPPDRDPGVHFACTGIWKQAMLDAIRDIQMALNAIRIETGLVTFAIDFLQHGSPSTVIVQLRAHPGSVAPGGAITVDWTAPSALQNSAVDWIGIFAVGADNHNYLTYTFVQNQTEGTHTFVAPSTPGSYEFRYLLNNGYVSVAASVPFVVG